MFLIKHLLKLQTRLYLESFYLFFLIWSSYADNFSRNIVILILIIFLVLDLLGKNVDFIRKYLFSEDSNYAFLDNINKYSFIEAERQTKFRKFTSKNINHYLKKIHENPNPKYGFVLENILLYNNLSI